MDVLETIKRQITENKIILYMKGSPENPQCGFSAQVVRILMSFQKPFAHVDILQNPDIRQTLPQYANWPTFPQLYINGELIGGCDIVQEYVKSGEFKQIMDRL